MRRRRAPPPAAAHPSHVTGEERKLLRRAIDGERRGGGRLVASSRLAVMVRRAWFVYRPHAARGSRPPGVIGLRSRTCARSGVATRSGSADVSDRRLAPTRLKEAPLPSLKLVFSVSTLVGVACALGVSASSARPLAGIASTTTCKPFVGTKWVNPYPPNNAGDHYQITVTGKRFTCKSAAIYVRKFIAEKIKPAPKLIGGLGYVKGGPAGYICTSGIGHTGTAYQGNCRASKPTLTSSSFTWGPYKDS